MELNPGSYLNERSRFYDEITLDELEEIRKWKSHRKRFRLLAVFMKHANEVRFRFDRAIPHNDPLSSETPFPVTQITGIYIYDNDGNILAQNNPDNAPIKKVEAIYGHISINYSAFGDDFQKDPKFSASGFLYDYDGEDISKVESVYALQERAKAALLLAYKAKAAGWTEVNFGRTSDQVERCMLFWACMHVGLIIMDNEKVDKSAFDNVRVSPLPDDNHPLVRETYNKMGRKDIAKNPFLTVTKVYFNNYIDSPNIEFDYQRPAGGSADQLAAMM